MSSAAEGAVACGAPRTGAMAMAASCVGLALALRRRRRLQQRVYVQVGEPTTGCMVIRCTQCTVYEP
jgi:hypothetical protein